MSRRASYRHSGPHYGVVLVLFLIGVGLTVGLYYVKTRAQSARAEALRLEAQLEAEHAAILVLQAEIAHLENPERLQKLAMTELNLSPIKTDQFLAPDQVEMRLPTKSESENAREQDQ